MILHWFELVSCFIHKKRRVKKGSTSKQELQKDPPKPAHHDIPNSASLCPSIRKAADSTQNLKKNKYYIIFRDLSNAKYIATISFSISKPKQVSACFCLLIIIRANFYHKIYKPCCIILHIKARGGIWIDFRLSTHPLSQMIYANILCSMIVFHFKRQVQASLQQ